LSAANTGFWSLW